MAHAGRARLGRAFGLVRSFRAGSAPDASRRASPTASRAPGRPEMTGLTDSAAGVPSGSSAGKSTALWRA